MRCGLAEIRDMASPARHAGLGPDQAGGHLCGDARGGQHHPAATATVCPELTVRENLWRFMRGNWLSNRVFRDHDDLAAHRCQAWNRLVDQPWRVMSFGPRDRAHGF